MKKTLIGAALVLASTAAFAQSGGQMAVPAGPDKQTYDVPAGSKDQADHSSRPAACRTGKASRPTSITAWR